MVGVTQIITRMEATSSPPTGVAKDTAVVVRRMGRRHRSREAMEEVWNTILTEPLLSEESTRYVRQIIKYRNVLLQIMLLGLL